MWTLFSLGVAAVLALPLAGKNCYLDEKALLVGGSFSTVRCGRPPAWRLLLSPPPAGAHYCAHSCLQVSGQR